MNIKKPVPTGEYAVGTFTYTVTDDRDEIFCPGTKRKTSSRVYYPVLKGSVKDLPKLRYMSRNMAKGISKAFKIPMNYDKLEKSGENISECYQDAPRIEGKKFPLVMFSHGAQSYREGNSYMCIDLASRGYVVISVGHSYGGVCTEFDDGTFNFGDKSYIKRMYEPMLGGMMAAYKLTKKKGTLQEIADEFDITQNKYCTFMKERVIEWKLDVLSSLEYAKENLKDLIDLDLGIGVSGHSLGGDVAYRLCCDEPKFVCGINIDGGLFGDYKDAVQPRPFMQISGEDNESIVARVYLRHKQTVHKVLFRDMKHPAFSDIKYKIPISAVAGKLDPDLAHENMCDCHAGFFDTYLKKINEQLDLQSNSVIIVTDYPADM